MLTLLNLYIFTTRSIERSEIKKYIQIKINKDKLTRPREALKFSMEIEKRYILFNHSMP